MKKMIALIMTLALIISCIVTVSADSPFPPYSEEEKLLADWESKLTVSLANYITAQTGEATEVTQLKINALDNLKYGEYYLVSFKTDADVEKEYFYRMGMYALVGHAETPVFADGFAVYTTADEQWHPLSYVNGKYDYVLEQLASGYLWGELICDNEFCYITHFAGYDFLNVTVATNIQKLLAGIDVSDEVTEDEVQYHDIDNDGSITIKDATAVQKCIAGLEIEVFDSIV